MSDKDRLEGIVYRPMRPGEEHEVCELVRQVFNEFIAQEFEKEGVQEFFRFANPGAMQARVRSGGFLLVASGFDKLLGMLEFAPPNRLAMLFVLLPHRGIAKELLARAIDQVRTARPGLAKLIVHSSRYAEPIYRRMGFRQVGNLTTENGITYIPMELDIGDRREA